MVKLTTLAVDPNYFAINWERTGEVLLSIIVFSILLERALAVLFENKWFINFEKSRDLHLKEIIAFVMASIICFVVKLDALTIIVLQGDTTYFGYIFTGAIIAGGSKASVKLFRDMMKVKSVAQEKVDIETKGEIETAKIEVRQRLDDLSPNAPQDTPSPTEPKPGKKTAKKRATP